MKEIVEMVCATVMFVAFMYFLFKQINDERKF